jgi:tRNA U34 5-methylaminomethyl-2-thiouridine-forming methyltransferase MnmC
MLVNPGSFPDVQRKDPEVFALALVHQLSAACANDCSMEDDRMVMFGRDSPTKSGLELEFRLIDGGFCKPNMDDLG